MARDFLAFPFAAYIGAFHSKPFNTTRGKGTMVAADLPWFTYSFAGAPLGTSVPNFAVNVNLNTAGANVVSSNWVIQSVYIDNEGVDFPVYIFFPDTQFAVSCPANSAGWYECYTGNRQALICAIGIVDNSITTKQRTRCFFTDVAMVPSLDQEIQSAVSLEIASSNLPRFQINGATYGTPALGDQPILATLSCTGGSSAIALAASGAGSFYYITGIFSSVVYGGASGGNTVTVQMRPHGSASVVWGWRWISQAAPASGPVFPASGFNLKLDGALQYDLIQVAGPATNDSLDVNFVYTIAKF